MNKIKLFQETQNKYWTDVVSELQRGYKKGPWMQCVFPVLKGSDCDNNSDFTIDNIKEAERFLKNEELKEHLYTALKLLINSDVSEPYSIFGFVDAERLRASVTLFKYIDPENDIYEEVINKFFNGEYDQSTEALLN